MPRARRSRGTNGDLGGAGHSPHDGAILCLMSSTENPKIANIPEQIVDKFLEQLGTEKTPPEIIARLKRTLVEDADFSEAGLRAALTGTPKEHDQG